jgi:hypothetical protein
VIKEAFNYLRERLVDILGEVAVTKLKGSFEANSHTPRFEVWTLGNRLQLRVVKLEDDNEEVRSIPLSEFKTNTHALDNFTSITPRILTHQLLMQICLNLWKRSPYAGQITDVSLNADDVDCSITFETPDGWMFLKIQPQIMDPRS